MEAVNPTLNSIEEKTQKKATHACDNCEKSFKTASNLRAHKSSVHEGIKPYRYKHFPSHNIFLFMTCMLSKEVDYLN